ncbi:MAG: hypothetical protein JXO44_01180 [Clostridia bacterium]|nr:hypothetical protein [Clostridia bacterium]
MYYILLSIIFVPLILAILFYLVNKPQFNSMVFLFQVLQTFFVYVLSRSVIAGESLSYVIGQWPMGIGIELRLDWLSLIFVGMTTLGFWAAYLYCWEEKCRDAKYFFFITFLQGSLVALFLVYDLFSMFILLELVTILGSILITYKKDGYAVKAGLFYLLYNSFGMTIFLVGVIILYISSGSLNMTVAGEIAQGLSQQVHIRFAVACFFVAFSLKSALVPVYTWLPIAHSSAPSSVSALLSGLMVKIGLYGFMRLHGVFSGPFLSQSLMIVGISTALLGVGFAVLQTDIKRILAYHTISQVGLMVVGISSGMEKGMYGGLLHMVNHFAFKTLLFLCAGILITNTGERHIKKIRGVMASNPFLGIAIVIGILGITGAPFFNGSISKYIIKKSVEGTFVTYGLYLVNFGTLVSFIKFGQVLGGPSRYPFSIEWVKSLSIALVATLVLAMFPIGIVMGGRILHGEFFSYYNLLKESGIYLIMAIFGWQFYHRVVDREHPWLKAKATKTLGFQISNAFLIVYFLVVVIFTRYQV